MSRRNREALILFRSAGLVDSDGFIRICLDLWTKIDLGLMTDDYLMEDRELFEIEIPTPAETKLIIEKMEFILEFYRLTDDEIWEYLLKHHLRETWSVFSEYELNMNDIVFVVKRTT